METEKNPVHNHYYHGGINFIACHMPNATIQTVNAPTAETSAPPAPLPAALDTPEARDVLRRLVQAGLADERWQPLGLSLAKQGVLASLLGERLGIAHTWATFGALWGVSPGVLRTRYNDGMNQKQMGDFISQINNAL